MTWKQSVLRVGCLENDMYIKQCPTEGWAKKIPFGNGISWDVLNLLQQTFLNNYRIEIVQGNGYGIKDSNGTWNGLVGQLVRGEIDTSVSQLYHSASRFEAATIVLPFIQRDSLAILYNPREPEMQTVPLFGPFQWPVWLCWIIAYLLIVRFTQMTNLCSPSFLQNMYNVSFQQRNMRKWLGIVPKILITVWALTSGRFVQGKYRAVFVRRLVPKVDQMDLDSLPDYILNGQYQFVTLSDIATNEGIMNEKFPLSRPLRDALHEHPPILFQTPASEVHWIRTHRGSLTIIPGRFARYLQRDSPSLLVSELDTAPMWLPIAVLRPNMTKDILYQQLSTAASQFARYGFWEKIMRGYRRAQPQKWTSQWKNLDLFKIAPAFETFLFCICGCIACFLSELLYRRDVVK